MVFSSFDFLLKFLPAFLAVYYIVPPVYRNLCILVFSLGFYAYGNLKTPLYILLFAVSILFNWYMGLAIQKRPEKKKALLWIAVAFDLGWLLLFKYSYFFHILPFKLVLPIGISFYTFQSMSYVIDVYRGDAKAERSPVRLGAYISMFPQLIAGPIVKYTDIRAQLRRRPYSPAVFLDGLRVFVLGLGAKVVLANQIGNLWYDVQSAGFESVSVPMAWLGLIGFSLQLYFDFWGYSLMAIGLGRMSGFELPQNFNAPYVSVSMTEFWRRWHMTLGSWFREYVYIPLGGNRAGTGRTYFNLFAVWMLTAFWHGADWNFLLWGLFLFFFIALEKLFLYDFFESHRALGHLYMALLIPVSWMLFAIDDLPSIGVYAGRLIGLGGEAVYASDWTDALSTYAKLLIPGLLLCGEQPQKLYRRYGAHPACWLVCAAVLAASIYCLYMGKNDPFLYFRF